MARIRKGDTVQVISGKDKGVKGTVLSVLVDQDKVIVEGVNRVKKHTKVGQTARGGRSGGIITQEAPIHVSNVMLVDSDTNRATRTGAERIAVDKSRPDGTTYAGFRNVRISRTTGKEI